MKATPFDIGAIITNGSSAGRVVAIETGKVPVWNAPGLFVSNIGLEEFGGQPGMRSFIPDYLLPSWAPVPFDWQPCTGGGVEERYVWRDSYRRLQREVRKVPGVQPTVDGIRGHRVDTPEEAELRLAYALAAPAISPEEAARLLPVD